jgi:hypothetical protein
VTPVEIPQANDFFTQSSILMGARSAPIAIPGWDKKKTMKSEGSTSLTRGRRSARFHTSGGARGLPGGHRAIGDRDRRLHLDATAVACPPLQVRPGTVARLRSPLLLKELVLIGSLKHLGLNADILPMQIRQSEKA